jgi:hypothetical protein
MKERHIIPNFKTLNGSKIQIANTFAQTCHGFSGTVANRSNHGTQRHITTELEALEMDRPCMVTP